MARRLGMKSFNLTIVGSRLSELGLPWRSTGKGPRFDPWSGNQTPVCLQLKEPPGPQLRPGIAKKINIFFKRLQELRHNTKNQSHRKMINTFLITQYPCSYVSKLVQIILQTNLLDITLVENSRRFLRIRPVEPTVGILSGLPTSCQVTPLTSTKQPKQKWTATGCFDIEHFTFSIKTMYS